MVSIPPPPLFSGRTGGRMCPRSEGTQGDAGVWWKLRYKTSSTRQSGWVTRCAEGHCVRRVNTLLVRDARCRSALHAHSPAEGHRREESPGQPRGLAAQHIDELVAGPLVVVRDVEDAVEQPGPLEGPHQPAGEPERGAKARPPAPRVTAQSPGRQGSRGEGFLEGLGGEGPRLQGELDALARERVDEAGRVSEQQRSIEGGVVGPGAERQVVSLHPAPPPPPP